MNSQARFYQTLFNRFNKVRLAIATVIIIVSFAFSYLFFYQQLTKLIQQDNEIFINETANLSSLALKEKIAGDLNLLKSMALVLGNLEKFDVDYWITSLSDAELIAEFQRLGFILEDGKGYSLDVYGVDLSDKESVVRVLNGEAYISDVIVDTIHDRKFITYMVPIFKQQQVIGGIGFDIYTDEYNDIFSLSAFQQESCSYVIDSNGDIIFSNNNKKQLFDTDNIFEQLDHQNPVITMFQQDLKQNKTGNFDFVCSNGQLAKLFYAPIGIKDWYIITAIPDEILENKSIRIQTWALNLSLFFAMLAITGLIIYVFSYKKQQLELIHLAYEDEVTSLLNKNGFIVEAQHTLQNSNQSYALVILNISKFKLVNDQYGYEIGDDLLRFIAKQLCHDFDKDELASRATSDQFMLLMRFYDLEKLQNRLKQIIKTLLFYQFPFESAYNLSVNLGVCLIDKHKKQIDFYIDNALLALAKAKSSSFSNVVVYDETLRSQLVTDSELEKDLLIAVKKQQFEIFLQPKINLQDHSWFGAEALVRWNHPTKGMIAPNVFIPILEKNGLIVELDNFVLDQVCQLQSRLNQQGIKNFNLSVNRSRNHFFKSNFDQSVLDIIHAYDIDPKSIELEITESVFIDHNKKVPEIIDKCRKVGLMVSIDDFGSGYSSLSLLKDIHVDFIKIDKVFLQESVNIARSKSILTSIIEMSKKLHITVVAEGVETKEQVEFLHSIGCDLVQGYYFNKPLSINEFEREIKKLF